MNNHKKLNQIRKRRQIRTRVKIRSIGGKIKPRLSVFKSNRYIYIQLIDDQIGKTIASVSTRLFQGEKNKKVFLAERLGELIAKKAKEKKIENVIFDRGNYKYHGQVKAIAESARKNGLKF
ncbi:50S ribosomal protein L18 [Candidatus Wolfebacteria bacterium]|nr:50S ribosomal protein L18 [Candidatus Wolfebacteria bacterium]